MNENQRRLKNATTVGRICIWIAILLMAGQCVGLILAATEAPRATTAVFPAYLRKLIESALLIPALVFLNGFFSAIRTGESPFTAGNAARLRQAAYMFLAVAILPGAAEFFYAVFVHASGSWNPSVAYLILASLLLALSALFAMGENASAQ